MRNRLTLRLNVSAFVNIAITTTKIKKKDNLGDYQLIQYQVFLTNIIRILWQTVRRITDEILGAKGLILQLPRVTTKEFLLTKGYCMF